MKYLFLLSLLFTISQVFSQVENNKWEKYFKKADSLFEKSDYVNAIIYYDSTILLKSDHIESYTFRGVSYYELKNYDLAIEDFNSALTLAPGYAEVYFYRGMCFMEKSEKEKACDDWQLAYYYGYKKALKILEQNCEVEMKRKKQD